MRRFLRLLLTLTMLIGGGLVWAQSLDEMAFTKEYKTRAEALYPDATVTISGPLSVQVEIQGKDPRTVYLDNAYRAYRAEPSGLDQVLSDYGRSLLDGFPDQAALSKERLIPVVRSQEFVDANHDLMKKDPTDPFAVLPFAGDLRIILAFDSDKVIRFARWSELDGLGIDRDKLLEVAIANFERDRVPLSHYAAGPIMAFLDLGPYGSTLMLSESFWSDRERFKFPGETVAFVVTRDTILVTGSEDPEGLTMARELAAQWTNELPYPITEKPLVRRNGKWEPFDDR